MNTNQKLYDFLQIFLLVIATFLLINHLEGSKRRRDERLKKINDSINNGFQTDASNFMLDRRNIYEDMEISYKKMIDNE